MTETVAAIPGSENPEQDTTLVFYEDDLFLNATNLHLKKCELSTVLCAYLLHARVGRGII